MAAMLTPAVASASTITVNIVNRDLVIFIFCLLLILLTTHWMSPDMILDTLMSSGALTSSPLMMRSSVRYQLVPGADTSPTASCWRHAPRSLTTSCSGGLVWTQCWYWGQSHRGLLHLTVQDHVEQLQPPLVLTLGHRSPGSRHYIGPAYMVDMI